MHVREIEVKVKGNKRGEGAFQHSLAHSNTVRLEEKTREQLQQERENIGTQGRPKKF